MIIPFANTYAVAATDLVPNYYNTLKAIQKAVSDYKDKDYGIKKLQSGGRGRKMLIDFYSLEKHIQQAIGDPKKVENPLQPRYEVNTDAVQFFSKYEDELGALTLKQIENCITNANVLIAAHILKHDRIAERQSKGNHSQKGINKSISNDVNHFNGLLVGNNDKEKIEHSLPTSSKRFIALFRKFLKDDGTYNFKSILPKRRGNSNSKKVTDHTLTLLNNLFSTQSHKPTRTEIARVYDSFLAGYTNVCDPDAVAYDPKDFRPLSYNTISNYLAQWKHRLASEAYRNGDEERFMARNIPHFTLEKPEFAGSLISVDDRQPAFVYNKSNDRMWFYLALDVASNAITCYVYGRSKAGIIRAFYQKLIANYWEWGWDMPHGIECESNLNSSYKNNFLRKGAAFQHVRIIHNNARTKIIESRNRALRYNYDKKDEGWIARPKALSEANQKGKNKRVIVPFEDIVKRGIGHIETWNNTPHDTDPTITRWEYACQRRHPKPNPWNWHAILSSPIADTQTSSCHAGQIRFRETFFVLAKDGAIALGDDLIARMERIEGKTFDIQYLLGNDGEVIKAHVYIGDQLQCEIIKQPKPNRALAEWTTEDRRKFEQFEEYVATIREYQKELAKQIEHVYVEDNGTRPTLEKTFFAPELQKDRDLASNQTEAKALPDVEIEDEIEVQTDFTNSLKNTF